MSHQRKRLYYKGIRIGALGLPVLIEEKEICIEEKVPRSKRVYHPSFSSPFKSNAPKNLLVLYDVPDGQKTERDWFRRHLLKFGYIMIQRSVWVGPSPLPKQFMDYVKEIGLQDEIKTFKLAKAYTEKSENK